MVIYIQRIYQSDIDHEGVRILIDRIWPRGISKQKVDIWCKDIAPSHELRKWYGHKHDKWPEFKSRYFAELDSNEELVIDFIDRYRKEKVILLFGSKEMNLNNANALKEYLETKIDQNKTS